jgi:hypothetical protein
MDSRAGSADTSGSRYPGQRRRVGICEARGATNEMNDAM